MGGERKLEMLSSDYSSVLILQMRKFKSSNIHFTRKSMGDQAINLKIDYSNNELSATNLPNRKYAKNNPLLNICRIW